MNKLFSKFLNSSVTFRLSVSLITFAVGSGIASVWIINRFSLPSAIPSNTQTEVSQPAPTPNKPKTINDNRDLSVYDFGGRQGCGIVPVSEASRCNKSIKTARNFIWKHWQEKKKGYIIIKMASDDAETDSHIFIEPDENGAWHIVWKLERIFAVLMLKDASDRIVEIPDIRSLERRRAIDRDYKYATGTFYLLFLGKNGEKVQSL